MSWIVVKSGNYRYLSRDGVFVPWSPFQADATRFATRQEAQRAIEESIECELEDCHVVKLVPKRKKAEVVDESMGHCARARG